MNLSDYIAGDKRAGFTLGECIYSDTAAREGIDNMPSAEIIQVMIATARAVLMPIRLEFNTPFSPNSFYRSFDLEYVVCAKEIKKRIAAADLGDAAKWDAMEVAALYDVGLHAPEDRHPAAVAYLEKKQHPKGNAIDITVPRVDTRTLAEWIIEDSGIKFDQLILEFWKPGVKPGWCHVSWVKQNPRRQILWTPDGANYFQGLPNG